MKLLPQKNRARWLRWGAIVYLVALLGSHVVVNREREREREADAHKHTDTRGAEGRVVDVVARNDEGPVEGRTCHASFIHWKPAAGVSGERLPVLMLHGSPGSARNFEDLGPELAARGYDAWALDLPGFGHTYGDVPSYSILAHARTALAAMDELKIARFHVLAWSMGGGVALHMADVAPDRVASLSLVACIGVQEGEGSGNYYFEHVKYAGMWAVVIGVPELLPHFGWIGGERERVSFVRNFWDSDQRPLRAILERTRTPILILHSRDDFLVPLWTAKRSHELARDSRLVLLRGSHFLPLAGEFGNLRETTEETAAFLARHDQPGATEPRELVDRTPERTGLQRFDLEPFWFALQVPWWLQFAAIVLGMRLGRLTTAALAGAMLAALQLDVGLALIAVVLGGLLASGSLRERLSGAGIGLGVTIASAIAGVFLVSSSGGVLPRGLAIGFIVATAAAAILFARRRRQVRLARRLVRMVR